MEKLFSPQVRSQMRILVMADTDAVPSNPDGSGVDLVISCGDVPDWAILDAAEAFQCKRIFAVKGNHDADAPFPPQIESLHLKVRSHMGFSFGGFNGCWQYKPRGHFLYEQEEVEELMACFPAVDVLVGHNSPAGIHERGDQAHTGFSGFFVYIQRVCPVLMIHGHQHSNSESRVSITRVIGVSGFRVIEYP